MSLPSHFPMKGPGGKTIDVPSVGFGTWAAEGGKGWCKAATLVALEAGYRHLDCAWKYGVDEEIGEAIRESGVPREEIFISTKLFQQFFHPDDVELCIDQSLKLIGIEYFDLVIAHWPIAFTPLSREGLKTAKVWPSAKFGQIGTRVYEGTNKPVIDWEHTSESLAKKAGKTGSFVPTWQALQRLVAKGKVRAIGCSNFSVADIEDILPYSKEIPVSCNQVEMHPWLPRWEFLEQMKNLGILVTCFSPFAGQKKDGRTLIKDPTVIELAKKNNMDVGQLLQSWAVGRGTIPLGKSQTESRIISNLKIKKLSPEDTEILNSLALPNDAGRTIDYTEDWEAPLF